MIKQFPDSEKKMKLNFFNLYLLQVVLSFKLDIKTASEILKRTRRENSGESYNGEFNGDNFERECVEERCDSEEFDEIFDRESGIVKVRIDLDMNIYQVMLFHSILLLQ